VAIERNTFPFFNGVMECLVGTCGVIVNARESIRVTGGNIDWIYPGRNERTSYTID
jgi:hypothetical protein